MDDRLHPSIDSPTYWVDHWERGYKGSCIELLHRRDSKFRHTVCKLLLDMLGYWELEEFMILNSEYADSLKDV